MGDILGFVGTIVGAEIQSGAQKDMAKMQINALERAQKWVYDQLDPAKVNKEAIAADIERAKQQHELQLQISPDLAKARYEAESRILGQVQGLGPESSAMKVGEQAAKEALAGVPRMNEIKSKLVDAALQELELGATLPSDVQAELVKAGLEQGGMVTGTASPKGLGGQVIRQLIGTAGLQLRQQRQQQAAALAGHAQNLETARQNILGTLFPNLSTVQLNQLQGTQNALGTIQNLAPEAGLTGSDVANLWLKRVGASGELGAQQTAAAKSAALANAQIWGNAIGAGTGYISNAVPSSTSSFWKSLFKSTPTTVEQPAYTPTNQGNVNTAGEGWV